MKSRDYDSAAEYFSATESAGPLIDAVRQLAHDRNEPFDEYSGKTYAELGALAEDTYEDLPSFWRVWKDWHSPRTRSDMGDL
jgi:hypothetical protein